MGKRCVNRVFLARVLSVPWLHTAHDRNNIYQDFLLDSFGTTAPANPCALIARRVGWREAIAPASLPRLRRGDDDDRQMGTG